MKRLYLSFAILFFAAACGSSDDMGEGTDPDNPGNTKPGNGGKLRVDAGSDAGALAGDASGQTEDGGSVNGGPNDGGTVDGSRTDGAATENRTDGAAATTFDGMWTVVMTATAATTCTGSQFEARIEDTWTFTGATSDTLRGAHLGPNPYERAPGSDVWNTGETTIAATADLELVGLELRGTFIFYRDTCNVFYDVQGMRP
jgi:hypothetical protein